MLLLMAAALQLRVAAPPQIFTWFRKFCP